MRFARFCRWALLYSVCNLQVLGAHSLFGFLFALYSFCQACNGTRDSTASSHPSYIIIRHCDLEKKSEHHWSILRTLVEFWAFSY